MFDAPPPTVVLPANLPAQCFVTPAQDYNVPPMVLVAMVKVESKGRSVVSRNKNGSLDLGVAQHNTDSWVPYFKKKFGIEPAALATNPCQSIRAAAYVLRTELNHKSCAGSDIWCAVGRYHAPNNRNLAAIYIGKVKAAMNQILGKGAF